MMFWSSPDAGDWVTLKRTTPVTFTDHLTGDGLPAGTRAVVKARHGGRLDLTADAGWGSSDVTVRASDVVVRRRGAGVGRFTRRLHHLTVVRVSLTLFLTWPVIQFVALYLWEHHTWQGLETALAIGLVEGALAQLDDLVRDPVRGILLLALFALLGRIAFGPSRR